jgi:hypothetical protein
MAEKTPPATNRGVETSAPPKELWCSLDWLTFTTADITALSSLLKIFPAVRLTDDKVQARYAYNTAMRTTVCRVDWHSSKPELKTLFTFTGKDLDHWRRLGYTDLQLVQFVSRLPRLTVTRLDFALDLVNWNIAPSRLYHAWQRGDVVTRARTASIIHSAERGENSGVTVYLGSRKSSKLLRVYDKGAQLRDGTDRVRIELETKKPFATPLLQTMTGTSVEDAGKAAMRDFVRCEIAWWNEATAGCDIAIQKPDQQSPDNWRAWVVGVCLPAILEALHQGVPEVVFLLERTGQDLPEPLDHGS